MKMHLGRTRRRLSPRLWIIVGLVLVLFLFEAYRLVMPYMARNPLYHEVTIGEPVIDHWNYEGEDAEGYLRFVDTATPGQDAILPPSTKLFGADGKFVVIEHADAGSLTYADPLEAAPPYWYALMLGFVGVVFGWMVYFRRLQRKRRMHLSRQKSNSSLFDTVSFQRTQTRFRPSKSPKRRRFR